MTPFASVALNFATGGAVVASVSVLATWLSPVLAAIWWSFPFTIIPSIYFMRAHDRSNQAVATFLRSTTVALGLLLVATYAMSYFFRALPPHDPAWWVAVAKGTGVWFACAVVFYLVYTRIVPQASLVPPLRGAAS